MGGYPSHDAPNCLFATAAQHPNNGGTTEICLIPLVRRHFNDTNKKLKDAVAQLYFKGPPNTSTTAIAAMHQGITSTTATPPEMAVAQPSLQNASAAAAGIVVPPVVPVGAMPVEPTMEQKRKAVQTYRSMENLLNEIECSFFASTRVVYESAKLASEKVRQKDTAGAATAAAAAAATSAVVDSTSAEAVQKPIEAPTPAGEDDDNTAKTASSGSRSQIHLLNSSAPVLRPVPCAVCIIEPDTSGRKGAAGHTGTDRASVTAAVLGTATTAAVNGVNGTAVTEWVTIQGRRLRCIGYLSCFSKQPGPATEEAKGTAGAAAATTTATTTTTAGGAAAEGNSGPKSPLSLDGKSNLSVPRISDCDAAGLDVYMELILANESKYMHLLEPVVFLASIMFRSQYLTSSMLQRAVHSTEVENAFYAHLQMLNIHVRLTKDRVHHLKVLHDQLPLMEFVDEMGLSGRHVPVLNVSAESVAEASHAAAAAAAEKVATADGEKSAEETTAEAAATDAETTAADGEAAENSATAATHADPADSDGDDESDNDDDDDGEVKKDGGDEGDGEAAATAAAGDAAPDEDNDGEDKKDDAADGDEDGKEAEEKDVNRPSNLSTSGTSRRTRRSRRRQRKPKVAQPQDEIYRKTRCSLPKMTFFTDSNGEEGLEAVFDGALLARLMKLIAETAAFETVKNSFIRCDLGPLMKERRHLLQSHREAMQEEGSAERQDARIMGSIENAETVRRWIKEGLLAEEEQRKQEEATAAAQAAAASTLAQQQQQQGQASQQSTSQPPQQAALPLSAHQQAAVAAAAAAQKPHILPNGAILPVNRGTLAAGNPMLATAATLGQNPAIATMGMVPANPPHPTGNTGTAAGTAGAGGAASMMVYVPGMGYVAVPNGSMMLPQAGAAAGNPAGQSTATAQAGQPTYIINPATGLPMMLAGPTANASAAGTPPQPQMMSFPNVMQLYNPQQQQQQQQHTQQQQQTMMSAAPQYYAQHAAAAQPQQQQYQYVMGPNGQLLMMPVMTASTAQPQQQYMMAAPSAHGGQLQQPVYMNPYMMSSMMNLSAQQQQQQQQQAQQQAQLQQMYIQQLQAQQLARQQQQQQQGQQQAAVHPFMMGAIQGLQPGQLPPGVMAGNSQFNMAANAVRTPAGTPPQQGSPAAAAVMNTQLPPHLAANYANMYAMAAAAQQQQQQASTTATSTPMQSARQASKMGGTAASAAAVSETHGASSHTSGTAPFNYATINDDDDDDDDAAAALAAATAAMEAIRGHGGNGRDEDSDDEDDTSQFFSNGQFFFRTQ